MLLMSSLVSLNFMSLILLQVNLYNFFSYPFYVSSSYFFCILQQRLSSGNELFLRKTGGYIVIVLICCSLSTRYLITYNIFFSLFSFLNHEPEENIVQKIFHNIVVCLPSYVRTLLRDMNQTVYLKWSL